MTISPPITMQALSTMLPRTYLKSCGLPSATGNLPKSPSTDSKGNSSTLPEDTLAIAQPLKALSASGIDLANSRWVERGQLLSFDLTYEEESFQQVSLSGYYNSYSERLTADFSFVSAMALKDPATGEERQELFRFNLHLEAGHSLTCSGSSMLQKEDILQFARKLVTKMAKLYAEGKEIDGLALDNEDLKELAAVDHGRLLERIMAIIEMMKMVSRLRQKNGEHVWLDLEREKAVVSQETTQEQESLDFSLTVERLQIQSTSESVLVEETAAAE